MILGFADKIKMSDLKVEIESLKKENQHLKSVAETYQKRLNEEMDNASFAIDQNAMKAFSVERNWNNGFPTTIIGYMLSEPAVHTEGEEQRVTYKDVVREWTLHCSAAKHEELVKEFVAWKVKKK